MKKLKVEVPEFPPEIIADILSRLPVDSIVACKRVCKTWRTLIDDPLFLYAYTNKTISNINGDCQSSSSSTSNSSSTVEAELLVEPLSFFILSYDEDQLYYGEYCTSTIHIIDHDQEEEEKEEKEKDAAAYLEVSKPIKFPPPPPDQSFDGLLKQVTCFFFLKGQQVTCRWAFVGSSDGLICLSAYQCSMFTYSVYVYNPMTREFVDLGAVETHRNAGDGKGYRASGFGYHPFTKKYKVVRIIYENGWPNSRGQVKVYTLGSGGGWRDKGEIPYGIAGVKKPGVLVNGALHWITRDGNILSFDLADEEFRIVLKLPPAQTLNRYSYYCTGLGVLRGCLSVGITTENKCTDVWVLMNNNNKLYSNTTTTTTDEPSWTRLPGAFYKPADDVLVVDDWDFNVISSYGLKYQSFRKNYYLGNSRIDIVPYTKSFVSLKALGEENVKKIC